MGLKDLLGGGTQIEPVSFGDGETELVREVATVHPGTLSSIPGDLVLTSSRLVFTPVRGKRSPGVITWRITKGKSRTKAEDALAAVRAKAGPGLLRPPTLEVTTGDGTRWEIGVLAGRRKANRSPDNAAARDRIVEAIQARLAD
jgi:hypothetical protein